MSRLENLSYIDFEDLCRDIAQAETGLRFSAFGPGPDGGVDGRHSKGSERTVLQCKHYVRSGFSDLTKSVKREVAKLGAINPSRYLMFTSCSLTPARSDILAELLSDFLGDSGDIWGQEDIEAALRRHPSVEKSHLKLWLSSSTVLDRLLHSGLESFTQITKEEILAELQVYVRNESFDEAAKKLEEQKVLIVSGPPGVGKTTLAKMLSYYYLNEGWQFYAIKTLDEGFTKLNDDAPTVFFFDDFLGRIQLDRQTLLQRESALVAFVRRVGNSKNARFVMTTRAHIFEEARQISDHIDHKKFQLARYLLDVGAYTRKVKASILFNHLSVSGLSVEHFSALLKNDWLKKIVDHNNYNPRVIASASSESFDDVKPSDYPAYLFSALENPDLIWSKPYRCLDIKSKNLLVALFFSNEYGANISTLRTNFGDLHRQVCAHYGQSTLPSDFEDALKSLESGFVSISGQNVSFVNPSLKDFLRAYLIDLDFLQLLPPTARRASWAQSVWKHIGSLFKAHPDIMMKAAQRFLPFSERIYATPTMQRTKDKSYTLMSVNNSSLADRLHMLLEWWEASRSEKFLVVALEILKPGCLELDTYRDGHSMAGLHWMIMSTVPEDNAYHSALLGGVGARFIDVINCSPAIDELPRIYESFHQYMDSGSEHEIEKALDTVIDYEFSNIDQIVQEFDSEDDLSEHLTHLEELAEKTGRDLTRATEAVHRRIAYLEAEREADDDERRPSFSGDLSFFKEEKFDDEQMRSLFSNLIQTGH